SLPHCLRSQKSSGVPLEEKMPRMWTDPGPTTVLELITDHLKTMIGPNNGIDRNRGPELAT
ncbi:MAG: hypothetical protein M1415_07950, partial [Firmicutes bacterium]|nr:hypothetical protein [Bacillota bacterium]